MSHACPKRNIHSVREHLNLTIKELTISAPCSAQQQASRTSSLTGQPKITKCNTTGAQLQDHNTANAEHQNTRTPQHKKTTQKLGCIHPGMAATTHTPRPACGS